MAMFDLFKKDKEAAAPTPAPVAEEKPKAESEG